VKVADGYARNYLYPQKLAAPVTSATRRQLEKKIAERATKAAESLSAAKSLAGKIGSASCTITVKAGPEGKLFGSVGSGDIAKALEDQGINLDRHQLELAEPIKELGVFKVPVKLHSEVTATLKVWIVEE
jgi:large subunit ribosomal protein L9